MLMREINLVNEELLSLLDSLRKDVEEIVDNYSEILIQEVDAKLYKNSPTNRRDEGKKDIYKTAPHHEILPDRCSSIDNFYNPVSREYLDLMIDIGMNKKHINDESEWCGWPNKEPFLSLPDVASIQAFKDKYNLTKKADGITYGWLNGNSRALFGLYPPGGYIPWHNNGNAPGYNILMHYSWGGDGSFYSLHNNEIIDYKDKDREWIARAGRFDSTGSGMVGDSVEEVTQENASWHCASTNCWRLTVSTIINSKDVWEDVIEEMESVDL